MPQHLIKLCVGAESVEDLTGWIAERMAARRKGGRPLEQVHTTRQQPKRSAEILGGGSLYWVIKGVIQCRQQIRDLRPIVDTDGIPRCEIVLEPVVHLVTPRPRGPFQGWRYLSAADAPPDLTAADAGGDLPIDMRRDLAELGLL
ncbi:MAG: DUF1489 domain-containing protein [Pseudomonadota bacterium]